jgi:hypothetical protein
LSPNGKIAPDVEAITREQPLVLFLGRLSWIDRLLQTFAHTQSGTLAVVGTDDENLVSMTNRVGTLRTRAVSYGCIVQAMPAVGASRPVCAAQSRVCDRAMGPSLCPISGHFRAPVFRKDR